MSLQMDRKQATSAIVVGRLADSYRTFQADLSAQLASQHPELSEALCLEVLRRQLGLSDAAAQHYVRVHHILTLLKTTLCESGAVIPLCPIASGSALHATGFADRMSCAAV
jgi:hypothetical protein